MLKETIATLALSCLSFCTYADNSPSEITLPQLEAPQLASEAYSMISLEPLKANTLYTVTCNINNSENGEVRLLLEPRLLDSSSYGGVRLNSKSLLSNAGNLQIGDNQLDFQVVVRKTDTDKYNRVKISYLSGQNTALGACVAKESSVADNESSAQKINSTGTHFFTLRNSSSRKISVKVGSFLPSYYDLDPNKSKIVMSSTDTPPNIDVTQVE